MSLDVFAAPSSLALGAVAALAESQPLDWLVDSRAIALVLSVIANVWLAREFVKQLDRNFKMASTVADLAAGLRESVGMRERDLHDRKRAR